MTTTTMHFGPEWMRTKQGSSRPAPSPPLTNSPAPPGNSTYSALVTPATNPPPEGRDVAHPFRYSKEEMLRIYKEGGGRGGLGLEVERWEGIVREVGYDPVGLKEMSDAEKKLFTGPLNSEARRRQLSSDFLSPLTTSGLGERPKLNHAGSGAASPMRERIGTFMGRRRGDSTDQAPLSLPRKLSLSNMQAASSSPREPAIPSPRVRPGFDGVLSDTWSSRRRTSEGVSKTGVGVGKTDKEPDGDGRRPNIKEEEEDVFEHSREASGGTSGSDPKVESNTVPNGNAAVDQVNGQLGGISIAGSLNSAPTAAPSQSPPGLADLSKVDWSYLDPQGQVQGPFPAETMQRWYNEGYFLPTLLMKRTQLDTEWTPVGELLRRAGDQPVFLSPLVHTVVAPPGLSRPLENVVDHAIPERNQHSPYQPVPTRTIRSSTLDSYLQNGSSAPESPSSSFSSNRFVNDSPDPIAFDNRNGVQLGFGTESRMPFASPGAGAAGTAGQRRATITDTVDQSFGSRGFGIGRAPMENGLFSGTAENPSVFVDGSNGSTFAQRTHQEPGHINGFTGSSALNGQEYGIIGGVHSTQGTPSRVLNRDTFGRTQIDELQSGAGLGGSFSNNSSPFISHAQASYPQTPLSQFSSQDNRSLPAITPISDRQGIPFSQPIQPSYSHTSSYPTTPQSPWASQDSPVFRRPGPFDATHPTTNNVYAAPSIAHTPSYNRVPQPSEQPPWQANRPQANDAWTAPAASLTVANLGHHDEQQRQAELQQQAAAALPDLTPQSQPIIPASEVPQPLPVPSAVAAPAPSESVPVQKTRRKSSAQAAQVAPQAPKVALPAPAVLTKPPSPDPQPEAKAAWATDEDKDKKGKPSNSAINLREIQETEAKKMGARKAVERERERAARASSQSEEFQSFTTSWGLPTSRAGTRASAAVEETSTASPMPGSTPSPAPSAPAVWTNAAAKPPTAKKTMKEIQEEEERRKKMVKEKETVAVTAKRAYADTTTKAATPPTGGAWTTVGSGGKTSVAVVAAARPAATPAASAKTVPTASTVAALSSAPGSRPATAVQAARAPAVIKSTPSKEEPIVAPGPSLEFLKWLGDNLKGLNSSVNLEEITSMLLSFPLDPDPTTSEIISDLIYASSTTLDGRRFASEFVSKRKADAVSRPKGAAAVGASKPVSIADVVKSQPKPVQNEWGGFKVVNKKKKGGRT